MIILQQRDQEILRICHEQQFLTSDHLKHFFKTHPSQIYRRVQELERAGFIERQLHPLTGRGQLLRLSKQGTSWIRASIPALNSMPRPVGRLNPSTLLHDTFVTTVRLRLQEFWNAEFLPERALKSFEFKEIPDGIFRFKSGKEIAIEIENSDKGRNRFKKLLERWKDRKAVVFVLFVSTTASLESIIKSYLTEAPAVPLMGVTSLDTLCKEAPRISTQRGEVNPFASREF